MLSSLEVWSHSIYTSAVFREPGIEKMMIWVHMMKCRTTLVPAWNSRKSFKLRAEQKKTKTMNSWMLVRTLRLTTEKYRGFWVLWIALKMIMWWPLEPNNRLESAFRSFSKLSFTPTKIKTFALEYFLWIETIYNTKMAKLASWTPVKSKYSRFSCTNITNL